MGVLPTPQKEKQTRPERRRSAGVAEGGCGGPGAEPPGLLLESRGKAPGWRLRSLRALGGLTAILLALTLPAQQAPQVDPAEFDIAARMILCDCGCHPQSVHECVCGRAAEMRNEIRGLIAQGMTGEQVIAHYVDRVGDQIRISPTTHGFNLVAWLGPLFALAAGLVLMLLLLRRWSRRQPAEGEPRPAAATPVTDDRYRQRLQDALEELE